MRIGVNTLFLVPGDVGGTEVYLRKTLSAMAALTRAHTLVLLTNKENDHLLRAELSGYSKVEFHQVPCRAAVRPLRILAEQFFLPVAARRAAVDVLWSPGYTAPAICSSPQAVTICDLQYKSYPEDMSIVERMTLDFLVRMACRRCQAVITISEFSRQEVIRYRFADADKVYAVPLGVDDAFACCEHSLDGPEQQNDSPYILCVAHTYPHKNVDALLDAFALLQEKIPHRLVLVGKARRGEESVRQSMKKIDPDRVVRLSGLADRDLQVLYHGADLFVLPSSYEGFGLPVLEAMMAGIPVVIPKMASLGEVGGHYAFYVPVPDVALLAGKILDVLALPPEERQQWVTKARHWAQTFTWKRTAMQTLAVLENIGGAMK